MQHTRIPGSTVLVMAVVLLGAQSRFAIAQEIEVRQTPQQKALAQLAEAEERLRWVVEMNKRCPGFYSELVAAERFVVAECRRRVELLAIVEVRQRQVRRGDIDAAKAAQDKLACAGSGKLLPVIVQTCLIPWKAIWLMLNPKFNGQ